MRKGVLVLDFGSQYTQLIARRIRELNIYCEIHPYNTHIDSPQSYDAVVLSGSPFSVRSENALEIDLSRFLGKVPVLGICYGAQMIVHHLGGSVMASQKREYGKAVLNVSMSDPFFKAVESASQVWMSHADTIAELPQTLDVIATTDKIPIAAFKNNNGSFEAPVYGIQFHPEVTHSIYGKDILRNFLIGIAGCAQDWTPDAFVTKCVSEIKERVGEEHVLMALSGGVDSTVGAMLIHRAIGERLTCFFVDNGLLRKNEFEEVLDAYKGLGLKIIGLDCKARFYAALDGVSDPEEKRKIIGHQFIEVFEAEAKNHEQIKWLGQGTIYPDVIESVSVHGPSVTIKSHHNVGGLPDKLDLKIIEPLRMLFKDEVRRVGKALDIPARILSRHPFPGPGLGIRILGSITEEKVNVLQEADAIYTTQLKEHGLYDSVWQAGAILLPVQTVGVMGDERTYESAVALRAVRSVDGMTAEWSKLPYDFLEEVSSQIINNVKGINRVVYDISTKPPATIEWE